ncbi:unnamed protein product [Cuscuta europaea]|uniref:Uncharacterized protein n=1 Tax=Cuscuta europaea TaxID=41803 RepID=A0A9P0ZCB7_CUSEU|nr:unnamed protein product [Cuscuta europaea]
MKLSSTLQREDCSQYIRYTLKNYEDNFATTITLRTCSDYSTLIPPIFLEIKRLTHLNKKSSSWKIYCHIPHPTSKLQSSSVLQHFENLIYTSFVKKQRWRKLILIQTLLEKEGTSQTNWSKVKW